MVYCSENPPGVSNTTILYDSPICISLTHKHSHCGLKNLGNSCFVNAVVQALYHIPALALWIDSDWEHRQRCDLRDDEKQRACVTCTFGNLFSVMQENLVVAPKELYRMLKCLNKSLAAGRQEDAHEFLTLLLNKIEQEYLERCHALNADTDVKETTPIGRIFGGWIKTSVACRPCRKLSHTYSAMKQVQILCQGFKSVQDSLNSVFSEEDLDDYKCSKCNTIQSTKKRYSFHAHPNVLILQLERFSRSGKKVKNSIAVPEHLQSPGEVQYKLVAAVLHLGEEMRSGHYVSMSFCYGGCAVIFSDEKVTIKHRSEADLLLQKEAYVLFYIRVQRHSTFPPKLLKVEQAESIPKTSSKQYTVSILKKGLKKEEEKDKNQDACKAIKSPEKLTVLVKPMTTETTTPSAIAGDVTSTAHFRSECVESPSVAIKSTNKFIVSPLPKPITEEATSSVKVVTPVKIIKRKKKKVTSSQSSYAFSVVKDGARRNCLTDFDNAANICGKEIHTAGVVSSGAPARVTPIKVSKKRRLSPKSRSSQSSHEYEVLQKKLECSDTQSDPENDGSSTSSCDSIYSSSGCEGLTECRDTALKLKVMPMKIAIRKRPFPKSHSSQSSHEYSIIKASKSLSSGLDEGQPKLPLDVSESRTLNVDDACHGSPVKCGNVNKVEQEVQHSEVNPCDRTHMLVPGSDPSKDHPDVSGDISGGNLPNKKIEANTKKDLKKWLQHHGLPVGGNKPIMVERMKAFLENNKGNVIVSKVDGLEVSRIRNVGNEENNRGDVEGESLYTLGDFPSVDIPLSFNFGHIYYYLVQSMPTLPTVDPDMYSTSESECEEAVSDEVLDPFDMNDKKVICNNKKLRRGMLFVRSKHLRNVRDGLHDGLYLAEAQVRASMRRTRYITQVSIHTISGMVMSGSCGCKTQALGRCSHVSALLLFMWGHIKLNGYTGIPQQCSPITTQPLLHVEKYGAPLLRELYRLSTSILKIGLCIYSYV